MLLGRKLISVGDKLRYVIDYDSWLDTTETLSSITFAVDDGPATVPSYTIAGDGKSVSFFVTGADADTPTFNVTVEAVTSATQEKNDHIEFNVVDA
jgi:hypothetical protein